MPSATRYSPSVGPARELLGGGRQDKEAVLVGLAPACVAHIGALAYQEEYALCGLPVFSVVFSLAAASSAAAASASLGSSTYIGASMRALLGGTICDVFCKHYKRVALPGHMRIAIDSP